MMLFRKAALLLLLILPACVWPDSVWFTFSGGADLPYDPLGMTNTSLYTWGGGAALSADYELPFAPALFLQTLVGFDLVQIRSLPGYGLGMLTAGPGAGVSLRLTPRLRLSVAADAGYLLASYNEAWSSSWFFVAAARLLLFLNPSFRVVAGAAYKYCAGLYPGAEIFLGASFQAQIEDM